jgi:DNA replication protein DnaC
MPTNPTTTKRAPSPGAELRDQAQKLGLWGLVAHWDEVERSPWIAGVLGFEEEERQKRSLERRLQKAKIGRFKLMADFDWAWPTKIDREQVEDLFRFEFISEAANVIMIGSNGTGKTMIAKNLVHQAILRGHTARFINASALLNDLAAQETGQSLSRCLRRYFEPRSSPSMRSGTWPPAASTATSF